jgi:hypothetical protein
MKNNFFEKNDAYKSKEIAKINGTLIKATA